MTTSLVLCLLFAGHRADDWVTYAPERGGFSVSLPGRPTESQQYNETTEVDFAEAVLDKSNCQYRASFSRIPKRALDSLPADAVIEITARSLYKDGVRVSEETKAMAGNLPVRILTIESRQGKESQWTKVGLCLVQRNMVLLQVSANSKTGITSVEANRFFASLKPLEK